MGVKIVGGGASLMTIRPVGRRVAVADLPAEQKSALIVVGAAGPAVGIVVELGEDLGLAVEKGDKVYYGPGRSIEVGDVKIIDADAIIAFDDGDRVF